MRVRHLILGAMLALGVLAPGASASDCSAEMQPLVNQLERMDERLDDGMYYRDYKAAVKKATRAYRRIDVPGLDYDCLADVGLPSEKALNRYITAGNIWTKFQNQGREVPPGKTRQMQRLWAQAETFIDKALRGL